MVKHLLTVISIMSLPFILAAEVIDSYKGIALVRGHGEVLPDSVRVRMVLWEGGSGEFAATDTIVNGQFRLEVPVGEGLTIGSLMFDYYAFPSMIRQLYLTPGATIEIDAVDRYMYTWPVKSNVPEQAESDLYVDNSKDLWTEFQKAKLEYQRSGNNDIYSQKVDSLDPLMDMRDLELLRTRPVGRVWMDKAIQLARYSKTTTTDMKALYANLDDSIKESPKGKTLYGYLYPGSHIGVGDKFPDVEFHDVDGNTHALSEYNGKWYLIDFWNAGCAPCVQALPELREVKEKYGEKLELISLSLDADDKWRKHSEKLPLIGNNWNEGKEDYGIFRRIGTSAMPTFVLVSPDGVIKDIWTGYGKGGLKQKLGFHLRPKGKTEYAEYIGLRKILFPKYEINKTNRVLDIDSIETDDNGTKIYFSFVYYPKHWISVSPDAYLIDPNGRRYKAIGGDGIDFGKPLYADEDGEGSFSISFEGVPSEVEVIDFHDVSSDESISIEGVSIKP